MMDDDPSARSSSDTRHAFTVLQGVNAPPGVCVNPGDPGCIPGAANGGAGALIDPAYKTPYALHASAGVQHAFGSKWMLSADWTHEAGVHAYRRYQYQAGIYPLIVALRFRRSHPAAIRPQPDRLPHGQPLAL